MVFKRILIAAFVTAAALSAPQTASAQSDCRRSCDRTFQACNRNAANNAACMTAWHACKRYCRSGQVTSTRANRPAVAARQTPRSAQPPRVTGSRSE